MTEPVAASVIHDMVAYYRARAAEYDEWFYRQGRYDHGPTANQRWHDEAAEVFAAFDRLGAAGDILELAPGTGIWTERLVQVADSVTAVDASAEMIAINQAKLAGRGGDKVTYQIADLFTWRPEREYDAVVFGFWISHVPLERLDDFLALVAGAVRPGGKVFFVDGRREPSSTAADHQLPEATEQVMIRRLNDGREYQIVKNFYDPAALAEQCARAGLRITVQETATYFLYGAGERAQGK